MSDFFCSDNDALRRESKACPKCRRRLYAGAFARDASRPPQELQSWCRGCKEVWEQSPPGGWKRFRAFCEAKEPDSIVPPRGWTEALYLRRRAEVNDECEYCGVGLSYWQGSGHCLDRINNSHPHVPANCKFACWPCNLRKSSRAAGHFIDETNMYVEKYGRGRVQWNEVMQADWVQPFEPFDVRPFIVPGETWDQLALLGAP